MEKNNLYPKNFPTPPDALKKKKLTDILKNELQHWRVVKSPLPINPNKERIEIFRELIFEDFDHVVDFINKLKPICNILPHHPRWENTWRTLKIYLSTWDAKHIITYKDILLARNIEMLYVNEFQNKYEYEKNKVLRPISNKPEIKLFIAALKKLIAEDEIEEVFKKIDTYYANSDLLDNPNELILIQSRYSSLISKLMAGTIANNEANVEMAQIKDGLLKMLTVANFTGE
jgi:pterin-4a-carbinolamine dehydratase/uncharacterized protein YlzI (FlbEa/FlbD family)